MRKASPVVSGNGWRTVSLRLRLGLWYGGLTGLVVLSVSALTYAVHSRAHYDDLDYALAGAAEHLAGEYAAMPPQTMLPRMLAVPIAPNTAVRIYAASGHLVAEDPGATLAPAIDPRAVLAHPSGPPFDRLVSLAPPIMGRPAGHGTFGLVTAHDGERWRLYVLPLTTTRQDLVFLASLERIDVSVAGLRQIVVLFTLGGAILTLVAGWLLASRALRPVAALTETAQMIARSQLLSRRVPTGGSRDELGQMAATFNEMLASLEQAAQAQHRFVSDASHELRAPLTAIQGNLDLLERQPDMARDERREAVQEANRETRRLAQLVADLLALARADAGVPLRHQHLELDRVLLDAFGAARHLAQGQHLDLAALEPSVVNGDPDRLKQVLLVLLDNAIKYTPTDGRVTLSLLRQGEMAQIVVADTGIGISSDDLPHVFERFYRADPARARDTGGTGLGLSIAQWIVEQHGGRLTLESLPGHGTTAKVSLPIVA